MVIEAMSDTNLNHRMLTVIEVAEYLHLRKETIYRLIKVGQLKAVKVGGAVRIEYDELMDYIKRQTMSAE